MSDSGPIHVVDPNHRGDGREIITLVMEYQDADDLIRDYDAELSSGQTFVQTERDLALGMEVTLLLAFPGLLKPLRIAGIVRSAGGDLPNERGAYIEFLSFDTQAQKDLEAQIERIRARDPGLVVRAIRVLVVEDSPHCAKLIQDGLPMVGQKAFGNRVVFDVSTASHAADAFTFLHSRPIDVLITDIYLGGVNGTTIIEHIRSDTQLRSIPVIAISAGDDATRQAALEAGADVFLAKPVRMREIVATVGQVLHLTASQPGATS